MQISDGSLSDPVYWENKDLEVSLANEKTVIGALPTINSPSALKTEVKSEMPVDGLGTAGSLLSAYHVGDITGLLGLLLTWLTYRQARAAKAAAQEAAAAAIKSRDRLETATRLSELSGRLRTIRDVYRTDDWSFVEVSKDHAVALAVEVRAIEVQNLELVTVMSRVEGYLREIDPRLEHIKDDEKRHTIKMKLSQRTNKLADSVDALRLKKVKHGN